MSEDKLLKAHIHLSAGRLNMANKAVYPWVSIRHTLKHNTDTQFGHGGDCEKLETVFAQLLEHFTAQLKALPVFP